MGVLLFIRNVPHILMPLRDRPFDLLFVVGIPGAKEVHYPSGIAVSTHAPGYLAPHCL